MGFNGIDGKEVIMSKLKDDINKIRDSKSTFIYNIIRSKYGNCEYKKKSK